VTIMARISHDRGNARDIRVNAENTNAKRRNVPSFPSDVMKIMEMLTTGHRSISEAVVRIRPTMGL